MYHAIVARRVRATFAQLSAGHWQPMRAGLTAGFRGALRQAPDRLADSGIAEAQAAPVADAPAPGNPGSSRALGSQPARFWFRRPLPYADPRARRGAVRQALVAAGSGALSRRLATTRIWRLTVWRAEPHLQRLSGGRLSTAAGLPTALLETRGARTGQWRRHGVIYFHDGDRVTIIASQAGYPGHPAWYYNLLANPEVRLGGERFTARAVTDQAERQRLWDLADQVFPAFADYRRSAARHGRQIPVIQLTRG
jgi:deazaflavin-dependent oxidoreductase (nitroreductase family)